MSTPTFQQELESLAERQFTLPQGQEAYPLLERHLHCLGDPDPRLRDTLFYEAADAWIGRGLLTSEQLARLAGRLLSEEFLFKGLGEPEGPDVFRRTFSALVLDSIVLRTTEARALDPGLHEAIAVAMERYAREEQDLRGFVPPFGWAHAVAHAADVLTSLMASPALAGWEARLLEAARQLLLRSGSVYTHQEDKRLARILVAHRRRHGARLDEFQAWIESLLEDCPASFGDMEAYARRTNVLDLLRALYFHLHRIPEEAAVAAWVEAKVCALMRLA